jgi:hypothetical protein
MARKSSKVDGRPAFQLYVKDYLIDPNLGACSLAAQGLWMRMLCMMFQAPERGCLVYLDAHDTVRPVEAPRLARMIGCSVDEVTGLLDELKREGVCSVESERGVVYNRRMRAEADEAAHVTTVRRAAGAKGGKSPRKVTMVEPEVVNLAPHRDPVRVLNNVHRLRDSQAEKQVEDLASAEEMKSLFGGLAKQTPATDLQPPSNGEGTAKQNGTAEAVYKFKS